jgi:hypothetical protein
MRPGAEIETRQLPRDLAGDQNADKKAAALERFDGQIFGI